jgi:hypothetical protein
MPGTGSEPRQPPSPTSALGYHAHACHPPRGPPNAAPQPLLEADARDERTLEAVGCRRLLDRGLSGLDPLEPLFDACTTAITLVV